MRAAQGEGSKEQIAHPQSTLDSSKQKKTVCEKEPINFNPSAAMSDQDRISPYNINTVVCVTPHPVKKAEKSMQFHG